MVYWLVRPYCFAVSFRRLSESRTPRPSHFFPKVFVETNAIDAQTGERTGKGVFPRLVLLTCDRCGHAMFFSAARIGVIDN